MLKTTLDRLARIFTKGKIKRPDQHKPQVVTQLGQIIKTDLRWPYGFTAFPEQGTAILLLSGGDSSLPDILYISDQDKAPKLRKNESAIFSSLGGQIILGNKILMRNKEKNLKDILDKIIDQITSIQTVGHPGQHVISPNSQTQLKAIKTEISQLLEGDRAH